MWQNTKHGSQESSDNKSKTSANITSNLKEHVAKHKSHASFVINVTLKQKTKVN